MANPATIGTEFQVNMHTPDNQRSAAVTGLADGGFVVTWQSEGGQDGNLAGIYAQRYDASGNPVGGELVVSTHIANNQDTPAVTALANGGFVITWESQDQDGSGDGVYGQRFDANGSPAGVEFKINSYTMDSQDQVAISAFADGGFVVVWESYGQEAGPDSDGIFGQRYDAAGGAVGTEFQVNSFTSSVQEDPAVATLPNGEFVVTWHSFGQDGSSFGVYGQRFAANGNPTGSEFQVNTYVTNSQSVPQITALADGGYVVTWNSFGQESGPVSTGVYGQRYDANGARAGTEFQVNTFTTRDQLYSVTTALADGGFLVAWTSRGQDSMAIDNGVYGQRFNADGTRNGTEFLINTETADDQQNPAISVLANGDVVVVWETRGQELGPASLGIFAQLFSIDLFSAGDDMVYLPAISPTGGWQALGGDDYVIGGDAANSVDGGDGSDWLYGGGGDDTINAGDGAMDVSLGDDGNDTINGEGGMDYMYGYAGNDTLRGGAGDDVAYGGTGNDELYGDEGADWLFGEAGNDKLFGGAGADLLMGGAGVDEITGGVGNDWMWGGDMAGAGDSAADTFFFGTSWGGDVIWDFEDGSDMLDVSGAGITSFADLTIGTFGQFTTITSATGDIIYLRGAGDVVIAEADIDAADFIFA